MGRKPAAKVAAAKVAAPKEAHLHAIEKIIRSRENSNGQLEYLIKWKDFPESENSWQSIDDLCSKRKSSPSVTPDVEPNVMAIVGI